MCMDDNADAKRILLVPLQQTEEDNKVVPASHGSAPSNKMLNNTTLAADLAQNRPLWRIFFFSYACHQP